MFSAQHSYELGLTWELKVFLFDRVEALLPAQSSHLPYRPYTVNWPLSRLDSVPTAFYSDWVTTIHDNVLPVQSS